MELSGLIPMILSHILMEFMWDSTMITILTMALNTPMIKDLHKQSLFLFLRLHMFMLVYLITILECTLLVVEPMPLVNMDHTVYSN